MTQGPGEKLIDRKSETARKLALTFEEKGKLLLACDIPAEPYAYQRNGKTVTATTPSLARPHRKTAIICAIDTAMPRAEMFNLLALFHSNWIMIT
ncbi:MAG: hypothetical protein ABR530_05930 [Pyrinomonadaceae bacterium]